MTRASERPIAMDQQVHAEYVVQTLEGERWRTFKRYICEHKAVELHQALIAEWGRRRVRTLVGHTDSLTGRRRYKLLGMTQQPAQGVPSRVAARPQGAGGHWIDALGRWHRLPVAAGLAAAVLISGVASAAILSHMMRGPSALDGVTGRGGLVLAVAAGPDADGANASAESVHGLTFGETQTLNAVPLRLRGDWSRDCRIGPRIALAADSYSDSADQAAALQVTAVQQTGQRYSVRLKDGQVRTFYLVSPDRVVAEGGESGSAYGLDRCLDR